jgi:hypothetical protein
MKELWECLGCLRTGELDQHGRCGRCGSDQVISQELVRNGIESKRGRPDSELRRPTRKEKRYGYRALYTAT